MEEPLQQPPFERTPAPKRGVNNRVVVMVVILFVLIIAGMFVFAFLKKSELTETPTPLDPVTEEPEGPYVYIERIDGKHYFIDGVHTVVGEILMPTPCDLLNTQVMVAESFPEQVTIDFSVLNNAETCAQVITPARFKVEAEVDERASWNARFDNRPVELNLIPAEPGERPEDFEVFIKG